MGKPNIVVTMGLQFGSEGKGQISGMIAEQWRPEVVVCANHPNAGHTYREPNSIKFIHRILPVGAIASGVKYVLIGPGAVVDPVALVAEVNELGRYGLWRNRHLIIHPNAAIVTPQDVDREQEFVKIGSTMKGSAEAVIRKMRRGLYGINTIRDAFRDLADKDYDAMRLLPVKPVIDAGCYDEAIDAASKILVEGAQGFSLGIHERFYPYGTSRDVSVHQVLADCRIPVGCPMYVMGVARSYPIRVANRFDASGQQIGTSGPCYWDQTEIDWKELKLEPELTTVTKLPRRIFTFSQTQIREAVRVTGANGVALTFCDYHPSVVTLIDQIGLIQQSAPVVSLSFGPEYGDVYDADKEALRNPNFSTITLQDVDYKKVIDGYFK